MKHISSFRPSFQIDPLSIEIPLSEEAMAPTSPQAEAYPNHSLSVYSVYEASTKDAQLQIDRLVTELGATKLEKTYFEGLVSRVTKYGRKRHHSQRPCTFRRRHLEDLREARAVDFLAGRDFLGFIRVMVPVRVTPETGSTLTLYEVG